MKGHLENTPTTIGEKFKGKLDRRNIVLEM